MYDDFTELENALKQLKPREPSEFCLARIGLGLKKRSGILFFRRWTVWAGGAVAVLGLLVALVWTREPLSEGPARETAVTEAGAVESEVVPLEVEQAPDGRFYRPKRMDHPDTTGNKPLDSETSTVKEIPEEEQLLPVDVI